MTIPYIGMQNTQTEMKKRLLIQTILNQDSNHNNSGLKPKLIQDSNPTNSELKPKLIQDSNHTNSGPKLN